MNFSRLKCQLHLCVGKGEAWAGQAMDSVLSESDKIFSVASEENLGVDPPIGSKAGLLRK